MPLPALVCWRVALGAVALAAGLALAGRRELLRPPPRKVLLVGVLLGPRAALPGPLAP